jgi:hypothetical protein
LPRTYHGPQSHQRPIGAEDSVRVLDHSLMGEIPSHGDI